MSSRLKPVTTFAPSIIPTTAELPDRPSKSYLTRVDAWLSPNRRGNNAAVHLSRLAEPIQSSGQPSERTERSSRAQSAKPYRRVKSNVETLGTFTPGLNQTVDIGSLPDGNQFNPRKSHHRNDRPFRMHLMDKSKNTTEVLNFWRKFQGMDPVMIPPEKQSKSAVAKKPPRKAKPPRMATSIEQTQARVFSTEYEVEHGTGMDMSSWAYNPVDSENEDANRIKWLNQLSSKFKPSHLIEHEMMAYAAKGTRRTASAGGALRRVSTKLSDGTSTSGTAKTAFVETRGEEKQFDATLRSEAGLNEINKLRELNPDIPVVSAYAKVPTMENNMPPTAEESVSAKINESLRAVATHSQGKENLKNPALFLESETRMDDSAFFHENTMRLEEAPAKVAPNGGVKAVAKRIFSDRLFVDGKHVPSYGNMPDEQPPIKRCHPSPSLFEPGALEDSGGVIKSNLFIPKKRIRRGSGNPAKGLAVEMTNTNILHTYATLIQAAWWGYNGRKRYREIQMDRLNNAATRIQTVWRGVLGFHLMLERKQFVRYGRIIRDILRQKIRIKREACHTMLRVVRVRHARRKIQFLRDNFKQLIRDDLPKAYDNFLVHKALYKERVTSGTIWWQRHFRGWRARQKAKYYRTVIQMQRYIRGFLGRIEYKRRLRIKLENMSARIIQYWVRGRLIRCRFIHYRENKAALNIQRAYRGHRGRVRYWTIKRAPIWERTKVRSAKKIQAIWRTRMSAMIGAAVKLQALSRGFRNRSTLTQKRTEKKAKELYNLWIHFSEGRAFRHWQDCVEEKKHAVVCIQRAWRIHSGWSGLFDENGEVIPQEDEEDITHYREGVTMQPNGSIIVEGGVVVAADGSMTLTDNTRILKDGTRILKGGMATFSPDGTIEISDGTTLGADGVVKAAKTATQLEDNTYELAIGAEIDQDLSINFGEGEPQVDNQGEISLAGGMVVHVDASVTLESGTILLPGGTLLESDGTKVLLDGTRVKPDGMVIPPKSKKGKPKRSKVSSANVVPKKRPTRRRSAPELVPRLYSMEQSAMIITRVARGYLSRKRVHEIRKRYRASQIVSFARMAMEQSRLGNPYFMFAATQIQRVYRGRAGKKRFGEKLFESKALPVIKRVQNRRLWNAFNKWAIDWEICRNAAIEIQRIWRGFAGRWEYWVRYEEFMEEQATKIQKILRGKLARNMVKKRRRARRMWKRGMFLIKAYNAMQEKHIQSMKRKNRAASIMQRGWLCFRARSEVNRRFQLRAALILQTLLRGFHARRRYRKAQKAAYFVQTRWRGYVARRDAETRLRAILLFQAIMIKRRLRRLMLYNLLINRCARDIQCAWRSNRARLRRRTRMDALIRIQSWRRMIMAQRLRKVLVNLQKRKENMAKLKS